MMKRIYVLFLMLSICAGLCPAFAYSSCGHAADCSDKGRDTLNRWAIDMTVLEVKGKYYAVWSGWEDYYEDAEAPGQNLYIARMTFHRAEPMVRLGKRALLSCPEKEWEMKDGEHISLLEGPSALYHDGDIFILYSTRGSWTRHYKIGALKLVGNDPLDPASWEKLDQPVFSGEVHSADGNCSIYGVGHASYVLSPDGSEYWVNFHAKTSVEYGWADRKVFLQRFSFGPDGNPEFGAPADPSVPMGRPSGETDMERADGNEEPAGDFTNPLYDGADPWMTFHDGKYYTCHSGQRGIWVTESRFMTRFEDGKSHNEASRKVWTLPEPETGRWNIRQLWAPEIHYVKGRWYIFYAAGRQKGGPFWDQRTGVLVSEDGPFGPYREHDSRPLYTGD